MTGGRKIKMEFRVVSPHKGIAKRANAAPGPGQPQIDGFARKVSNPLSRKRSERQIAQEIDEFDNSPWGDSDGEHIDDNDSSINGGDRNDPIEVDETDGEEDVPLARKLGAKKRKVVVGAVTTRKELGGTGTGVKKKTTGTKIQAPWAQVAARENGRMEPEDVSKMDQARSDMTSPVTQCFVGLKALVQKVSRARLRCSRLLRP
jgi:hypothetical protein